MNADGITEKLCYAHKWPHEAHEWADWDWAYDKPAQVAKRHHCDGAPDLLKALAASFRREVAE